MTSVKTFTDCMEEFLTELKKTFPDQVKLKTQYQKFVMMKKTNPRKIVDQFMEHIENYREVIINKDEEPVLNDSVPFLTEMGVKEWWTAATDKTKDAIWKYMNTLMFIGNAINTIPEDMMTGIEKIAKQCAKQMTEENSEGPPDLASMMSNIQNMMGPMMKEMGQMDARSEVQEKKTKKDKLRVVKKKK